MLGLIDDTGGLLLSFSDRCFALPNYLSNVLLAHHLSLLDNSSNVGIMNIFGLLPNLSYGLMSLRHHDVNHHLRLCSTLVEASV